MSKELPYFKFYAAQWLLGNISDEHEKVQGLFIRVCAIYWDRNCTITMQELNKKVHKTKLKGLENLGFISEKDGRVCIRFLDEQWIELSGKRAKKQASGAMGGNAKAKNNPSNAKDLPEQTSSNIEVEVEVDREVDLLLKKEAKGARFMFKNKLLELGYDKPVVEDWMKVRKLKKAANTETALNSILSQIEKTGLDKNAVLKIIVEEGWSGFKKSWLDNLKATENPSEVKQVLSTSFPKAGGQNE